MMELNGWSVTYPDGTAAVKQVTFSLTEGERLALIGANGAGKSSLLLSLVGVLPGTGTVRVGGTVLEKRTLPDIRRRVGLVFQNPDDQLFLPTVMANAAFGPANLGLSGEEQRRQAEETLELLHISHLKDKSVLKLSGGEKRMAALASVLAMRPSILLLDEPTAFLDPRARRNLIRVLAGLSHTMLIATHDLAFAAEVCPRSLILKEGMLFAEGASGELLYDERKMEEGGVEAIGVTERRI